MWHVRCRLLSTVMNTVVNGTHIWCVLFCCMKIALQIPCNKKLPAGTNCFPQRAGKEKVMYMVKRRVRNQRNDVTNGKDKLLKKRRIYIEEIKNIFIKYETDQ